MGKTNRDEHGVRNDRVRAALAIWAERKDAQSFADVMRRAVVGELLLDITDSQLRDPSAGPQAGDSIAIASQRDNAGKRLLVAFSGNDELARYRGRPGVSLAQPAAAVLAQAQQDYEGIVIDGRSAGAFIAYAAEIEQQLAADAEAAGRLAEPTVTRSLPFADYLRRLAEARVFIPVEVCRDDAGQESGLVVPAATDAAGNAYAVLGTAPAEIWAWSPRAEARGTTLAHVARAALEDGQAGLVVNPAGPPVTVPAEALRQLATG